MKKALLGLAAIVISAGAFAQTPAAEPSAPAINTAASLITLHNDLLMILDRLKQAEASRTPAQDSATYCYFNDKAYSRGASRDGQVCVNSALVVGQGHDPLHWVSKQDAERGNY
ncbi:TPA: hypothetical protein ACK3Q6_004445 [Burkholderia cepacia]